MDDFGKQCIKTSEKFAEENSPQSNQEREWVLSIIARAEEIVDQSDISCIVQDLLDLIIEVTLADSANFFQLDEATDELVITHVRGEPESKYLIGLRLNRKQGLPGISLSDTNIKVIDDLSFDSYWLHTVDPLAATQKKNLINLPVIKKDRALGVIQIFNFQRAELDLISILAGRLAVELDRHEDLNMLLQSNQRLLTLVDMLGEVAGTMDRDHLLHLVTECAARLVDAERSSVFLVDPTTSEMIFQVAYQPQEEALENNQNNDRYSRFFRKGQNHKKDIGRPKELTNSLEGEFSYCNRSAITVPLRGEVLAKDNAEARKHVLGGLMVLNKPKASFKEEDAQFMQILANQASTFLQVAEMYESSGELFLGAIKSLVSAIDAKDPYTQGHSQRVSDYSVLISEELGFNEAQINDIRIGSLLHDIGKIGIPDSILLKNGKLDEEEMKIIREHPQTDGNILSQVKLLDPMRPAILEHHERLDGSGYPAKLTDKQISWMGRIVAVTDVFDAMTSNRPYRKSLSIQEVLFYLNEKAGILFDSKCVQTLEDILARSN